MPKGVTPGPRQFTLMAPGNVFSSVANPVDPWEHTAVDGPGLGYFYTTPLDLRGLIVDDQSRGIEVTNINLQEAGPYDLVGETDYFVIFDILTTVRPTREAMAFWFVQPSLPGIVPGFLPSQNQEGNLPLDQIMNPSQVTWGMWRMIGNNPTFRIGTDVPPTVISSGLFGEGEPLVSPIVYWTRLIVTNSDGAGVNAPSANLVVNGNVVELSTTREVSQMMRASQR